MILEEIFAADSVAVVLSIILLISRHMARRHSQLVDKIFTILIFIGIAGAVLEAISFAVDGRGGTTLRIFNILDNTLLYSCTATVSILWVLYVDLSVNRSHKRSKALYIPLLIIWAGLIISLFFNLAFEFLFSVTPDNIYVREPAGYAFYAYLFGCFILTIIMYINARIKRGEAQFFPIWMFLTPVIAACIFQAIYYGISLAWVGCAVGLIGIHINIQSKFSLVDPLTNLYNRAYIEHKLIVAKTTNRYVYSGIMLDIDYFKSVNDSLGHSLGDKALVDAANILLSACDRNSLPFRFAGDEFVILIKVPINEINELESRTIEIENKIRKLSEEFNTSKKAPYKIVFSMGHAFFNKLEEEDEFFRDMDMAMYKEKQVHHSART